MEFVASTQLADQELREHFIQSQIIFSDSAYLQIVGPTFTLQTEQFKHLTKETKPILWNRHWV